VSISQTVRPDENYLALSFMKSWKFKTPKRNIRGWGSQKANSGLTISHIPQNLRPNKKNTWVCPSWQVQRKCYMMFTKSRYHHACEQGSFFFQFCDVTNHIVDGPQEALAKFGYRSVREKNKNLRNPATCWQPLEPIVYIQWFQQKKKTSLVTTLATTFSQSPLNESH